MQYPPARALHAVRGTVFKERRAHGVQRLHHKPAGLSRAITLRLLPLVRPQLRAAAAAAAADAAAIAPPWCCCV